MTLSEEMISKAGYDPNSGVERTLLPVATAAGKDKWVWFFTIDDEAMIRSDDPPQSSEQAMLNDAIAKARVRIDSYTTDPRPFVTGR